MKLLCLLFALFCSISTGFCNLVTLHKATIQIQYGFSDSPEYKGFKVYNNGNEKTFIWMRDRELQPGEKIVDATFQKAMEKEMKVYFGDNIRILDSKISGRVSVPDVEMLIHKPETVGRTAVRAYVFIHGGYVFYLILGASNHTDPLELTSLAGALSTIGFTE